MAIVLFDTKKCKNLFPLTATRALGDLRMGIFSLREWWQMISGQEVFILTAPYLSNFYPVMPTGNHFYIDASVLPFNGLPEKILNLKEGEALSDEEGLIAGKMTRDNLEWIPSEKDFKTIYNVKEVKKIEYPHQIFQWNAEIIHTQFALATKNKISGPLSPSNRIIGTENIFIEAGAKVEFCIINASEGPVYIGRNALLMEGSMLRGPVAINEGAVLKMGTKIYGGTTIGPYSMAGGEIKNSVIHSFSNKAHDGYLGDSVLGAWCNLGAGTSNSNIKNTASDVKLWNENSKSLINAGQKCGLIMGDYSRTAINSSINTGTVIGVCCQVYGAGLLPKIIPDFTWGSTGEIRYEFDKALKDIANWKKMKNKQLEQSEKKMLKYLYELPETAG